VEAEHPQQRLIVRGVHGVEAAADARERGLRVRDRPGDEVAAHGLAVEQMAAHGRVGQQRMQRADVAGDDGAQQQPRGAKLLRGGHAQS
jgi:hypothetical protein